MDVAFHCKALAAIRQALLKFTLIIIMTMVQNFPKAVVSELNPTPD